MVANKKCTLKILDEVNCTFIGLHPDTIQVLYNTYSVYAPNYNFNPEYKIGRWDGKLRYFQTTGKTYIQLLPEIVPQLVKHGYSIKTIDAREQRNIVTPVIDENLFSDLGIVDLDSEVPWKIRDYQVNLVNALLSHGSGVGIAGTGAGKTSMTAAMILAYQQADNLNTIVIVPDINLVSQTVKEYRFFKLDVGEYSGNKKQLDRKHLVTTWQSLMNVPTIISQYDVVIVDECHGIRGKVLSDILLNHGKHLVYRFGVTGTMPKHPADIIAVKLAVGKVRYKIPAHQLISSGYLSNLNISIIQHKINLKPEYEKYVTKCTGMGEEPITYKEFKLACVPDWTVEKSFLSTSEDRMEWLANMLRELPNVGSGNTLCLVNGIKFGKALSSMVDGSHFIHGNDDIDTRQQIYSLFKDNNNIMLIATINVASTGLDIKRIFNIVMVDVGKSFFRVIQTIGRGLRKASDKDFLEVYDICSDLKYSSKHLSIRKKYYDDAKYNYKIITTPLDIKN